MFKLEVLNRIYKRLILLNCLILVAQALCAQKVKKVADGDSVQIKQGYVLVLKDTFYIPENDSTVFLSQGRGYSLRKSPYFKSEKFYDSLESKANKTKLTRSLYGLLFSSSSSTISDKKPIVDAEASFIPFKGKTYGKIVIKRVPILEGSVRDTTKKATSWYAKTFNNIHIPTKKKIIMENVFIQSGQEVDPYQLADNERILRQFRTIRDAKIYLSPTDENPDVVDVIIVTQDLVSLGGAVSFTSPEDFSFDVYQRNILGYARDFQVTYSFNENRFPEKKHGYALRYRVPNLWGTFIRATLLHENFADRKQFSGSLSRDFFTPEIKYGGGASLSTISTFYEPVIYTNILVPYSKNEFSVWLGRSYQLKKRTNLILQTAFQRENYTNRPSTTETANRFFINYNQVLLSASILNRTYSKSKLIKGFGRTEDITKGFLLSGTYGFDALEFYNRNYWEVNVGYADYFKKIGYIFFSNTIGSFKNLDFGTWEDGVSRTEVKYFSPLIKKKNINLRQFITLTYSKGINIRNENYLTVDNSYTGDNLIRPYGNERLNMDFETVYFTPWYFYGCRFALYNRYRANWLTQNTLLKNSDFFSAFSLGIRILNESLVFPTIEISFSFLDAPPQYVNDYQFRIFNNYSNTFQDLMISRPSTVEFQN